MADPIFVFEVLDGGDWIAAQTARQALNEQVAHSGEPDFLLNDARRLSDAELDRYHVLDEEFGDEEPVTFRVALERLVKAGATFPRVLATNDQD